MKRVDRLAAFIADEYLATEVWGWQGYPGRDKRGYYHFRHPEYLCKITFSLSSECLNLVRVRGLLICEIKRRWAMYGYRQGYNSWGEPGMVWADPHNFRRVIRLAIRRQNA